jgi:hypothetical protein
MARTFLGGTRLAELERMMMTPPRFGYDTYTEQRKTSANLREATKPQRKEATKPHAREKQIL